MEEIEKEIKFEVKTLGNLALRLEFISQSFQGGTSYFCNGGREKNSYLDFGRKLSKRNTSLRIREYCNKVTITKKKKGDISDGIKSRPETNIDVDKDFGTVLDFFKDIGASEVGYYEKENRSIYKINYSTPSTDYVVCIDTILDGQKERYFVEIEGPSKDRILTIAKELNIYEKGLGAKIMEESYSKLFARKRR